MIIGLLESERHDRGIAPLSSLPSRPRLVRSRFAIIIVGRVELPLLDRGQRRPDLASITEKSTDTVDTRRATSFATRLASGSLSTPFSR